MRGNRASLVKKHSRAKVVAGMIAGISKMVGDTQHGISMFDFANVGKRAQRWLEKMAGGGRISGRTYKPNGAKECARRVRQMREKFDSIYSGRGIVYAHSYANEIVTKAVCVFRMTGGNTWEAMKAGVNMGRDTDCLTAVAGGISGALCGAGSIPKGLIEQTDYATSVNPHTNSQRTLRQTSDGLYRAFQGRLAKMKTYIEQMDTA